MKIEVETVSQCLVLQLKPLFPLRDVTYSGWIGMLMSSWRL